MQNWLNEMVAASIPLLFLLLSGRRSCRAGELADLTGETPPDGCIWLDSLDVSKSTQGAGHPRPGRSAADKDIKTGGVIYRHGLGTHSQGEFIVDLKSSAVRFESVVGLDEAVDGGSVEFEVWVDGKLLASSGLIRSGDSPQTLKADLTGAQQLVLLVTDGGDGTDNDHADWAGACIKLAPGSVDAPEAITLPPEPPPPLASGTPPQPEIHGPRVVGGTPGRPFLFLIPATGDGPLRYSADGLPGGLSLDSASGIISGSIREDGEHRVTIKVNGPAGDTARELRIISGKHKLARTPPLGWNSWNVWAGAVDADKVKAAGEWMVKTGLAAHGYQYVNIDDCWEADRDADGNIRTNDRFPDMKGLADYLHSLGLKIGIYSSPGPKTCAGFEGSYGHEEQDAKTYAEWGIDYLKYDWCSYGSIAKDNSREELMKPYRIMREALDKCGRDIVFSLCQYGMGNVWEWADQVGGNCWRTTGDIGDTWSSMSRIGFSQDGLEKYSGPGHWNDPDMMVVGELGWGPDLHPTRLTQNEQITHMTLWSLVASPILLGCDLARLDQFTLDLLTNDDVLDVHQDELGRQAKRCRRDGLVEVWARPLTDGTTAAGLFNRSPFARDVEARWADLGLSGALPVRDLWLKKDLEVAEGSFKTAVPAHGAVFIKIGAADGRS